MKAIVSLPFTPKASFLPCPLWWVRVAGSKEQIFSGLSICCPAKSGSSGPWSCQWCLACMRPSQAHFHGSWKTPFLCSPLGEICCNVTWFPCEYVCALQRLYLAPFLVNSSERQTFVELGLATPCSPLETALSRTFSRHVCRGLHCCLLFMLGNKLDLTICSCFWHLSLVQKFPLWSVKK